MEGYSVQELSAIQMNAGSRQIVDVYHAHAKSQTVDTWPRRHIHGLNNHFLHRYGYPNEDCLLQNFRSWLCGKNVLVILTNNPRKEGLTPTLNIKDISLPPWSERVSHPSHQVARRFKNEFIPILDKRCCAEAHSAFEGYPLFNMNETEIVKRNYGFHCSLYSAYEMYLCYIMN